MGWFDEQIKQRKNADNEMFEESFVRMAEAVLGKRVAKDMDNARLITQEALDDILKYYRCKPCRIPDGMEDVEEQFEFALRPNGIMRRRVVLTKKWFTESFGPLLAFDKETGMPVALIPGNMSGYYYSDAKTGEKVRVNSKTAENFGEEALCFYKPLPNKKLGIPDLIMYIKDQIAPGDIVSIVAFTVLVVLIQMIMPALSGSLTGVVLRSGNLRLLMGIAMFMICALLSSIMITAVKEFFMSRISLKASLSVEAAVMMRLMSLPAPFFRQHSAGELSNCMGSINSICELMLSAVFSTGLYSLTSLLFVVQIFAYAPALVVPSLLIILSTVVVNIISSLMRMKLYRKQMEYAGKNTAFSYSLITGIQKIKLAGAQKRAFAKWADIYSEEAKCIYDPPLFLKVNAVIIMAITLIGNVVLYYMTSASNVGVSDYYAFNIAFGMASGAFVALAGIVNTVSTIKPMLGIAEPILKEEPEVSEGKEMITRLSGNIELNNVYFRYNENMPYVLNNLSLKIRSGEYVAIVGKTGCGKSTIVRLLLGFEKPEKGAIYYDGKDISRIDLKSLRSRIGAVTQNGKLFQGDIYSNIVVSAPHLTPKDAWEAAETAGIAEDIREFPMGMNTIITEGEGGISGGQKQRLMIARAIAPKPRILIFDEATSALDNKTQKQVSEALDRLKCTRIVIAHRLSTIKNCDRIIVLSDGGIVEQGTYEELTAHDGAFAALVKRQQL
ncbi:MAG: ATP-binding cassette domain-containing protein [Lachnospiraceae bacterium]|nr:ATP-binding cassette domain-containing protein [Lachnospiraceae bacterium]